MILEGYRQDFSQNLQEEKNNKYESSKDHASWQWHIELEKTI